MTLVDTGPIVALINRVDPLHDWAVAQTKILPGPLLTSEPVLTEAFFLLASSERATARLSDLLDAEVILADVQLCPHFPRIGALMHKYRNVPMSFADALTRSVVGTGGRRSSLHPRFGFPHLPQER